MRHRRKTVKLQRNSAQRKALLSGLACSLIEQGRIRTTLAKAKALKPIADKMVTLGKMKTVHARRQAFAFLHHKDRVKKLFEEIAPAAANRQGGYTRVIKLGLRASDSAPMALIQWVDLAQQSATEEQSEETAKA
jgi:large subunit ribosomal protein L17